MKRTVLIFATAAIVAMTSASASAQNFPDIGYAAHNLYIRQFDAIRDVVYYPKGGWIYCPAKPMSRAEIAFGSVHYVRMFLEPVDDDWFIGATDERLQDPRLRKITAENFWRIEYLMREHRLLLTAMDSDSDGNHIDYWAMLDLAKARLTELGIELRDPYNERFLDVPEGHWADEAIHDLRRAGILYGYSDGTFRL